MARLYHYPLSPFCRKVRLTLAEKKIDCELVEERYWQKDAELLHRNPAGKVPVLKIDGETLAESAAICEYLDETRPEVRLMPEDPMARYEVRRMIGWFDDKFNAEVTAPLLMNRVYRKVMSLGAPDSGALKSGAQAARAHLDYLRLLLESRRWLAGEQMTLADFAGAAHLSALDFVSEVDWDRSQAVRDWYAKIKSRPSFRGLLRDQIPGFVTPAHYADLDF